MKVLKGISLLSAAVIGIALIAHGTSNLNNQPSAPVSPSVKPANIQGQPQRGPPDSFRGLKWDSALPNFKRLRETALKGCVAIVEEENLNDTRPCTHSHTDTDDMDMFIQRQNVSPIFDVPVSEQLVTWSHKKFWAGSAFIYGYRESDLAKLRAALIDQYGQPTFSNEEQHLTKWTWRDQKLVITLTFDPVAKPAWGTPTKPPQTSISLSFGRTE